MSMPPVLTEAASPRSRLKKSEDKNHIPTSNVLQTIGQHVLLDGFKVVVDLEKSRGSYLYDAASNRRLIDLYGFFGSMPVGFNHPYFANVAVQRDLLRAAKVKVANSDVYSEGYAEFVETFARIVGLRPLERYLFIEGGALAVENCLKAAMDWKVRKNMAAGHGERGTQVLHFRHAFHGRTGYTVAASPVKCVTKMQDLGAAFALISSHILADFPIHRCLQTILDRERAALDKEIALQR